MSANSPTKILFLSTDPRDVLRLRVGQELRDIREQLKLANLREEFILEDRTATRPRDISQAILDFKPHIVHFSGHGTETGNLCFEDELGKVKPVTPKALTALFKLVAHQVNCVVLNACYSDIQAEAIVEHISCVIGMNKAIGDRAAIIFAVGLYKALVAGEPVDRAFEFGLVDLQLEDIPEELTPVIRKKKTNLGSEEKEEKAIAVIPNQDLTPPISIEVEEENSFFEKEQQESSDRSSNDNLSQEEEEEMFGTRLPPNPPINDRPTWMKKVGGVLLASLLGTGLIVVVRQLGWLEILELKAYDFFLRSRPEEVAEDLRIVVVEANAEDLKKYGFPLPDRVLAQVLQKVEAMEPQSIGLDIYRDIPIEPGNKELLAQLKSERVTAVCQVPFEGNAGGVAPPPGVSEDRQGFSNVVYDIDGVIRRQLLAIDVEPTLSFRCTANYSLSFYLALYYLQQKGIEPKDTYPVQLDRTVFNGLDIASGGYFQEHLKKRGYQILLNYRSPQKLARRVTVSDVLDARIKPDWIKERIVLIGVTDPSKPDIHPTPYGKMPGVLVQAQMTSQIISAVLDRRVLLQPRSPYVEVLWIWGWSLVGGAGVLVWKKRLDRVAAISVSIAVLALISYIWFVNGIWIPLIPAAIVLIITARIVLIDQASNNLYVLFAILKKFS